MHAHAGHLRIKDKLHLVLLFAAVVVVVVVGDEDPRDDRDEDNTDALPLCPALLIADA